MIQNEKNTNIFYKYEAYNTADVFLSFRLGIQIAKAMVVVCVNRAVPGR